MRLLDKYPVREEYRGKEGTVVGDWPDVGRFTNIRVVYDFRPDCETLSPADTLIPICDDLDADKISAFIDDM